MAASTVSFLLWIVALQWVSAQDYSSQWAAHIGGGPEVAQKTAEKHGFVLLGEVIHIKYSTWPLKRISLLFYCVILLIIGSSIINRYLLIFLHILHLC